MFMTPFLRIFECSIQSTICCILICRCMQNYNNTIKTSDTVLRKIYLSLYLRSGWRPNRTPTYWPSLLWPSRFFPVLLGCSTGGQGPSLSGCWFSLPHLISTGPVTKLSIGGFSTALVSNWSGLQLIDFLSSPSYIIVQRPLLLVGVTIALIQPIQGQGYNSDIPRPDAPVIHIGAFSVLTARPGRRSIYNTYKNC